MSTWKCLYYALVCCLGSRTLKWPIGWSIYRPQLKSSRWRKAAAFCGTSDSPVEAPDSPVPLSGAPSRWICQMTVGVISLSTGQSVPSSNVPLGTSRWATVP
jgi:hypothetical protein